MRHWKPPAWVFRVFGWPEAPDDPDPIIFIEGMCPVPFREGLTIFVTPDYYMEDGIRMPVDWPRAQSIAKSKGMLIPTYHMVDCIWNAADIRLEPKPMPPGAAMTSIGYARQHDAIIEDELRRRKVPTEAPLIAGHKKDIVRYPKLGRVAIYGWHRLNGIPIQNLSNVHGDRYSDYSHGLRLVHPKAHHEELGWVTLEDYLP